MSARRRNRKQLLNFIENQGGFIADSLTRLADYYDEEAHVDGPLEDCDDACAQCDDAAQANSFRETRDELRHLLCRV
ncbi:hypothetical protein [Nocardia sp. NPDC004722]